MRIDEATLMYERMNLQAWNECRGIASWNGRQGGQKIGNIIELKALVTEDKGKESEIET